MMTPKSRRFVLDLSDLYDFLSRHTPVSGIQRLLLSVASRIDQWNANPIVLGYWDPILSDYRVFPTRDLSDDYASLANRLRFPLIAKINADKFADRHFARAWYRTRRTLSRGYSTQFAGRVHRARIQRETKRLTFTEGDVLLSLGAGWNGGVRAMLNYARPAIIAGHVTPIFLVHDLIPLLPGIEPRAEAKNAGFKNWLDEAVTLSDRFLVCSQSTERDFARSLVDCGKHGASIERFALAHELPKILTPDKASTLPPTVRALNDVAYVLVVGSALGRKNGARLIEAWKNLLDQVGLDRLPKLVFAGSSRPKDLTLPENPEIAEKIVFVRSPDEPTLTHLYERALFCCFPSLYEGWGLPIGEALAHGKLCITSYTSSMPEVAGPYADYFDPYDVQSMTEAIARPILEQGYLASREEKIRSAPLRNWDETTYQLFSAVARLASC